LRLLDLCADELGVSRVFAARGWECVAVDLVPPRLHAVPAKCEFWEANILGLYTRMKGHLSMKRETCVWTESFDFAWASTPCEGFSVFGMPHFHPKPPYPESGVTLFNHARSLLEKMGIPYVMENVRSAEQFVGPAVAHCGPFYLWGNAVPPILPQGIKKGFQTGGQIIQRLKAIDRKALTDYRRQNDGSWSSSKSKKRKEWTAKMAMIPSELANCVADYAERLLEQRKSA
jgi:hypothetical protein